MISINVVPAGKTTRQATHSLSAGIFTPVENSLQDGMTVIYGGGYGVEARNKRLITANTNPIQFDRRKPAGIALIEAIAVTTNDGSINAILEAVMPNITILSKEIRQHDELYNLNDLHKAAKGEKKHQPSNFLRLSYTRELIKELNSSDVRSFEKVSGRRGGTFARKELIYAYAMWISPKFHLAVIRAFDQIQTEQPKPTTKESLAVADQTITIVTTIEPGQLPTSQTYQGKVALMPCDAILEYEEKMRHTIWDYERAVKGIMDDLLMKGITAKGGQTDPLDMQAHRKQQHIKALENA